GGGCSVATGAPGSSGGVVLVVAFFATHKQRARRNRMRRKKSILGIVALVVAAGGCEGKIEAPAAEAPSFGNQDPEMHIRNAYGKLAGHTAGGQNPLTVSVNRVTRYGYADVKGKRLSELLSPPAGQFLIAKALTVHTAADSTPAGTESVQYQPSYRAV